jgi:hypothetical protein
MYIANTIDGGAFIQTQYRMYALFPSLLFAVVAAIAMGMGSRKGVLIPNDGILVMWDILVATTSVIRN